MRYGTAYIIAVVLFLALDALWLGVVAKNLYFTRMADILLQQPKWVVAIIFYAVYVVGLTYFGISTGMQNGSWQTALLNGALFGFFCYLTYDFTNLAVLKGYDPLVAVVDTIWGTVLSGVVSAATILILRAIGQQPAP